MGLPNEELQKKQTQTNNVISTSTTKDTNETILKKAAMVMADVNKDVQQGKQQSVDNKAADQKKKEKKGEAKAVVINAKQLTPKQLKKNEISRIRKFEEDNNDYEKYGVGFDLEHVDINAIDSKHMRKLKNALKPYLEKRREIFEKNKLQEKDYVRDLETQEKKTGNIMDRLIPISAEEQEELALLYAKANYYTDNYLSNRGKRFKFGRGKKRRKQVDHIKELLNNDNRRFYLSVDRRKILKSTDVADKRAMNSMLFPSYLNAVFASDRISDRNQAYRDQRRRQRQENNLPSIFKRHNEWWKTAMINNGYRLAMGYHITGGLIDRTIGAATMIAANALTFAGKVVKTPLKIISLGVNLALMPFTKKRWNVNYSLTKGWSDVDEGRKIFRDCAKGLAAIPTAIAESVVRGFPYLFRMMAGKDVEGERVFKTTGALTLNLRGRILNNIRGLGFGKSNGQLALAKKDYGNRNAAVLVTNDAAGDVIAEEEFLTNKVAGNVISKEEKAEEKKEEEKEEKKAEEIITEEKKVEDDFDDDDDDDEDDEEEIKEEKKEEATEENKAEDETSEVKIVEKAPEEAKEEKKEDKKENKVSKFEEEFENRIKEINLEFKSDTLTAESENYEDYAEEVRILLKRRENMYRHFLSGDELNKKLSMNNKQLNMLKVGPLKTITETEETKIENKEEKKEYISKVTEEQKKGAAFEVSVYPEIDEKNKSKDPLDANKLDEYLGEDVLTDEMEARYAEFTTVQLPVLPELSADTKEKAELKKSIRDHLLLEQGALIDDRRNRTKKAAGGMHESFIDDEVKKSMYDKYGAQTKYKRAIREILLAKDSFDGTTHARQAIWELSTLGHIIRDSVKKPLEDLDLNTFIAADDAQFVAGFGAKYDLLSKIEAYETFLDLIDEEQLLSVRGENKTVARAKLETMKSIRQAYEDRMKLISSPYYTALSTEYLESFMGEKGEEKLESARLDASVKDYIKLYKKVHANPLTAAGVENDYNAKLEVIRKEIAERDAANISERYLSGVKLSGTNEEVLTQIYETRKKAEMDAFVKDDLEFLRTQDIRFAADHIYIGAAEIKTFHADFADILTKGVCRGTVLDEKVRLKVSGYIHDYVSVMRELEAVNRVQDVTSEATMYSFNADTANPEFAKTDIGKLMLRLKNCEEDETVRENITTEHGANKVKVFGQKGLMRMIYGTLIDSGVSIGEKYVARAKDPEVRQKILNRNKEEDYPSILVNGREYTTYNPQFLSKLDGLDIKMKPADAEKLDTLVKSIEQGYEDNMVFLEVYDGGGDRPVLSLLEKYKNHEKIRNCIVEVETLLMKYKIDISGEKEIPAKYKITHKEFKLRELKNYNDEFSGALRSKSGLVKTKLDAKSKKNKSGRYSRVTRWFASMSSCMFNLKAVSDEGCQRMYEVLSLEEDKCSKYELNEKARAYEMIFNKVMSYDLKSIKIGKLSDGNDKKMMELRFMCQMMWDFHTHNFDQYEKMIDNPEVSCAIDKEQLKEVRSRWALFQTLSNVVCKLTEKNAEAIKNNIDIDKLYEKTSEEIMALSAKSEGTLKVFYSDFVMTKEALKLDGYTPGDDIEQTLEKIRKNEYKLPENHENIDKTISNLKESDRRKTYDLDQINDAVDFEYAESGKSAQKIQAIKDRQKDFVDYDESVGLNADQKLIKALEGDVSLEGVDIKYLLYPVKVDKQGKPLTEEDKVNLYTNNDFLRSLKSKKLSKRQEFLDYAAAEAGKLAFTFKQLNDPKYIVRHKEQAIRHLSFFRNLLKLYSTHAGYYLKMPPIWSSTMLFNLLVRTDYVNYSSYCIQKALLSERMRKDGTLSGIEAKELEAPDTFVTAYANSKNKVGKDELPESELTALKKKYGSKKQSFTVSERVGLIESVLKDMNKVNAQVKDQMQSYKKSLEGNGGSSVIKNDIDMYSNVPEKTDIKIVETGEKAEEKKTEEKKPEEKKVEEKKPEEKKVEEKKVEEKKVEENKAEEKKIEEVKVENKKYLADDSPELIQNFAAEIKDYKKADYPEETKAHYEALLKEKDFPVPMDLVDLTNIRGRYMEPKYFYKTNNKGERFETYDFFWKADADPLFKEAYDWLRGYYRAHQDDIIEIPPVQYDEKAVAPLKGEHTAYEAQGLTLYCWACTMNGLMNEYAGHKVSDLDMVKKTPLNIPSFKDSGFTDRDKYDKGVNLAERMHKGNETGNPAIFGDYIIDKLPDTAVYSAHIGIAPTRRDFCKRRFLETLGTRLEKGPVGLLYDGHFVLVYAIDGVKLKVRDSQADNPDTLAVYRYDADDIFASDNREVELVWLENIKGREKDIAREFSLDYDEENHTFSGNVNKEKETILHKNGVEGMKAYANGDLVSYQVYVPKQVSGGQGPEGGQQPEQQVDHVRNKVAGDAIFKEEAKQEAVNKEEKIEEKIEENKTEKAEDQTKKTEEKAATDLKSVNDKVGAYRNSADDVMNFYVANIQNPSPELEVFTGNIVSLGEYLKDKKKHEDENLVEGEIVQLKKLYDQSFESCKAYLATLKDSQSGELKVLQDDFQNKVQYIFDMLEKDKEGIDQVNAAQGISLKQLLSDIRTEPFNTDNAEINEYVGGNINRRLHTKKDGQEFAFTETKEVLTAEAVLDKAAKSIPEGEALFMSLKTDPGALSIIPTLYTMNQDDFIAVKEGKATEENRNRIREYFNQVNMSTGLTLDVDKLMSSEKFLKEFSNVMEDHKSALNSQASNEMASIKKGRSIEKRNVAMTRVAELMGMSSLIAHTKTASIVHEGVKKTGVVMEWVTGMTQEKIGESKEPIDCNCDGKVLQQLSDIEVLDFICGNVDRHMGNLIYTVENNKIVSVKGVDNDSSFGNLKGVPGEQTYHMAVPKNMLLMRHRTASMIIGLRKEELALALGDLIAEDEIDDAWSRVEVLKEQIRRSREENPEAGSLRAGYTRILADHDRMWDELDIPTLAAVSNKSGAKSIYKRMSEQFKTKKTEAGVDRLAIIDEYAHQEKAAKKAAFLNVKIPKKGQFTENQLKVAGGYAPEIIVKKDRFNSKLYRDMGLTDITDCIYVGTEKLKDYLKKNYSFKYEYGKPEKLKCFRAYMCAFAANSVLTMTYVHPQIGKSGETEIIVADLDCSFEGETAEIKTKREQLIRDARQTRAERHAAIRNALSKKTSKEKNKKKS